MRIERLSPQPDRAGRYTVTFEDGSKMRLYRQTVEDFCLYSGMELDDDTMLRLQMAAGQMSARMRAVRIVSASSVSKKELQQRLIHKGESVQDAEAAVGWMEELDLLDDEKTARQIVERCIGKGYGIARAKQALYEKRIPKQYWDDVLADYPELDSAIAAYIKGHLTDPDDAKQVQKIINALLRRGHGYRTVRRILEQMQVDGDFLEEY